MNKRDFMKTLGAGALGIAAAGAAPSVAIDREPKRSSSRPERTMNWMWMYPGQAAPVDEWKRRFAEIRANNIHAILPEIYNGRRAFYRSNLIPSEDDWLETIVPIAHEEGLEVHAWMWCMPCNAPEIITARPDWYAVNGNGDSCLDKPAYVDYYRFMCPNRPGVRDFLVGLVQEISAIDGLDGVHFDYIRFPDVIIAAALQPKYGLNQDREYPEYDYCYCEVCRNEFRNAYEFDPLDLPDPAISADWREFRYNSITRLVNDHLIPTAGAKGKVTSAATFPNWEAVRQRWHTWDLDFVLPMLYHSFYYGDANWVRDHTRSGIDRLREHGKHTQLFSGLFVHDLYPDGLTRLIEKSYEGGAKGVVLFSYGGMNDRLWGAFREVTAGA